MAFRSVLNWIGTVGVAVAFVAGTTVGSNPYESVVVKETPPQVKIEAKSEPVTVPAVVIETVLVEAEPVPTTAWEAEVVKKEVEEIDRSEAEAPTMPVAQPKTPSKPAKVPAGTGKRIVVSRKDQRLFALEDGVEPRVLICSTSAGEIMPDGVHPDAPHDHIGRYSVLSKAVIRLSDAYFVHIPTEYSRAYGSEMPYALTYYNGHKIHETVEHKDELGLPRSMGCVRLGHEDAVWIYYWAEIGTPVRVIKESYNG